MTGWRVEWNGTVLSGDECPGDACLLLPPDGLGVPPLRNEDVTYVASDGVRMHRDWYEPRVLTFQAAVSTTGGECSTDCSSPDAVRRRVQEIMAAWSRQCSEGELVLWAPCDERTCDEECDSDAAADPAFGPYAIRGRPRGAVLQWAGRGHNYALLTLRFDAVDHRIYLLNGCGDPGTGQHCTDLLPTSRESTEVCWDPAGEICWDANGEICFVPITDFPPEEGPQPVTNNGTECACAVVTLRGPLQMPSLETDDGQTIDVGTDLGVDDVMVIDCCAQTVTLNGAEARYLVDGCIELQPGTTMVELLSFSGGGSATICFQDNVISA